MSRGPSMPSPEAEAEAGEGPALAARRLAVAALQRVEQQGAYLNLAVRQLLRGRPGREAAAGVALATGVLRWRSRLDYALERVSARPVRELDPDLRQILRVAAYEMGFSRGTPTPVAVDLAVSLARRLLHSGAARYANGVLRALARASAGGPLPSPESDAAAPGAAPRTSWERLAITFGHPPWLVHRWVNRYGEAATRELLLANNRPRGVTLRVNPLRATVAAVCDRLREQSGVEAQPGRWYRWAVYLTAGDVGPVEALPGYADGWFTPQDEAAMLAAAAVHPDPAQLVLDLCSAPGGKTTHLAEMMADRGEVVGLDRHASRLRMTLQNARRLGLQSISAAVADARSVPFARSGRRPAALLLDAPCSALGVIGRRPDIRWRRDAADVARAAELQAQLLDAAADWMGPGDRLVYSVCSLEPEETNEQVARLLARHSHLEAQPLPRPSGAPSGPAGDAPWQWWFPSTHGTDGFFVACFSHKGP